MLKPLEQQLVEAFYAEVWNQRSHEKAHEILAPNFVFRGSLGDEKLGVDGFIAYMEAVHTALAKYECIIRDLVMAEGRVAAQMTFQGIHQADFFGVAATGRTIAWSGAAFFTIAEGRIQELWVLGDIDAIKAQLS